MPKLTPQDFVNKKLDKAVFATYSWRPDLVDEKILKKLLSRNLERASQE